MVCAVRVVLGVEPRYPLDRFFDMDRCRYWTRNGPSGGRYCKRFCSQPQRRGHRQPVAQVGRKGGCAKGEADAVGYDAGKKVKGRKIHALVDTEGLPLRVVVHSPAIQDRDGAALVLDLIRQRFNCWVVERTFSWFGRNRRLAKDYENLADTLAAFITLACIQLAIRRLARA